MCSKKNFDQIVTEKQEYQNLFELGVEYMAHANFKRDIQEKWRNEASNTDDWDWKKHKA